MSSVSTNSTAVEPESYEKSHSPTSTKDGGLCFGHILPALRTSRPVGKVITEMLLKNTHIGLPPSDVNSAEPEDVSLYFGQAYRCFDELSNIVEHQYAAQKFIEDDNNGVKHSAISRILLPRVPRVWVRSRNAPLLPL